MTMHSATLAINEAIQKRRAAGEEVLHLGFGEAGLPVPDFIAEALHNAVGRNGYGAVVGSEEARQAAAEWFSRRGLPTEAEQIIFAPGSKALLFAAIAALPGDLILARPSWVSYAAQAALLGKPVIEVPIPAKAGGVPDPALLEAAILEAKDSGGNPGILLLTVPDNPTGTVASEADLRELCRIAEKYGLAVISDEIYAETVHSGESAPSATSYLESRTIVTTGLSKSLALGGWRIGFARIPSNEWGDGVLQDMVGIASEVWSSLAAPMQAVAAHVLSEPDAVREHIERSTRLHAVVANAVCDEFLAVGAHCRRPEAGFYIYPDFEPIRPTLERKGIRTSEELASVLLDRYAVGVLPGAAFGDDPSALRARVATSLLYGASEQERWEALRSEDPLRLPWIAGSLEHLRTALQDLAS
ncbi:pyridoxal phosphate-dependent aminotransferase [Sinomonas terrae]|uniref:Aminotransferase n=1 Tax=Sinomonas terrae TaxID=2908838 RepID=A0ABS9U4K5_9MICC|nr:pyridoxal phosphate-dependent aminotransferase [Sinomonas terrae]MCH6471506.1 pyridoxal phosphate-dependent aminotransferase [Sinomonas terrae]